MERYVTWALGLLQLAGCYSQPSIVTIQVLACVYLPT